MTALSLGTRNLKFMQRAAAKSGGPAVDALPRAALQAEEEAKWSLPSSSMSTIRSGPSMSNQGEHGAKVSFESSYAPFLGFGVAGEGEEDDKGEGSSRRAGGGRIAFGGFGQEEVKEEDEESDEEGQEGDPSDEERDHKQREARAVQVRRDKLGQMRRNGGIRQGKDSPKDGKKTKRPRSPSPSAASTSPSKPARTQSLSSSTHITSKGFARPSNYIPPAPPMIQEAKSTPQEPAKKMSTADRLKQIAKSRLAPTFTPPAAENPPSRPAESSTSHDVKESPTAAEGSSGQKKMSKKARQKAKKRTAEEPAEFDSVDPKRIKVESSTPSRTPSALASAPVTPSTAVLDAREKELKAQRKREAKARRKEKQAQRGDERSR